MSPMPAGPPVKSDQLMQDDPDDFAEGQGHDGEVVAAQAQHRKTEDDAPQGRENAGDRQGDEEGPGNDAVAEPVRQIYRRQQGIGIGADRIEGDVAQIEQVRRGPRRCSIPSPA